MGGKILVLLNIKNRHTTSVTFMSTSQFLFHGVLAPSGPGPSHCRGFTITLRHTTFARTPLSRLSGRRRDLYLTTHNTHKRQTPLPTAGFEPEIPGRQGPQTHEPGSAMC